MSSCIVTLCSLFLFNYFTSFIICLILLCVWLYSIWNIIEVLLYKMKQLLMVRTFERNNAFSQSVSSLPFLLNLFHSSNYWSDICGFIKLSWTYVFGLCIRCLRDEIIPLLYHSRCVFRSTESLRWPIAIGFCLSPCTTRGWLHYGYILVHVLKMC